MHGPIAILGRLLSALLLCCAFLSNQFLLVATGFVLDNHHDARPGECSASRQLWQLCTAGCTAVRHPDCFCIPARACSGVPVPAVCRPLPAGSRAHSTRPVCELPACHAGNGISPTTTTANCKQCCGAGAATAARRASPAAAAAIPPALPAPNAAAATAVCTAAAACSAAATTTAAADALACAPTCAAAAAAAADTGGRPGLSKHERLRSGAPAAGSCAEAAVRKPASTAAQWRWSGEAGWHGSHGVLLGACGAAGAAAGAGHAASHEHALQAHHAKLQHAPGPADHPARARPDGGP